MIPEDARTSAMRALVAAGMRPDDPVADLAAVSLARHLSAPGGHDPLLTEIVLKLAGLPPSAVLGLMFSEAAGR